MYYSTEVQIIATICNKYINRRKACYFNSVNRIYSYIYIYIILIFPLTRFLLIYVFCLIYKFFSFAILHGKYLTNKVVLSSIDYIQYICIPFYAWCLQKNKLITVIFFSKNKTENIIVYTNID